MTTAQRRREAARAEAAAGNARRRAAIAEARAAAARARRAALEGERRAAAGGRPPADVLDRWQITEDQWVNGRALAQGIKRDIRAAAGREADELGAWLSDNSLDQITRPTALRRQRDLVSGRTRSVRTESGYDWLEGLDGPETRRVRGRMTETNLYTPDLLADQVRRVTNLDLTDDEAMSWLVDQWLREDGLRAVASGRVPKYANPENLIPGDYANEGYRIADLFGVDLDDAAGHVAQVQAEAAQVYAERVLGRPQLGPAPWQMDAGDYVRELELLDATIAESTIEAPTPVNVLARLRELAPPDIDVTGDMAPMEIFERIRITAQAAGYEVP